jgi:aspartate/methionine/tyrosine aminotransferase
MKNDMLMAKTDEAGWINLAIGEPGCLQDTFGVYGFYAPLDLMPEQAYPPLAGTGVLLEQLKRLHPEGHIVVTAGAKQALLAAIHGCKSVDLLGEIDTVVHRKPYWPSHKTLSELSGCRFVASTAADHSCIRINTSPNNPDGSIDVSPCDIWDAAYAHSIYGFDVKDTPPHRVAVYSAAKLLGMSGDRVGWLVTNDEEIAQAAAAYVESTTSGVSIYSQRRVADVLWTIHNHPELSAEAYRAVQSRLTENAQALEDVIDSVVKSRGMFAWFRLSDRVRRQFATAKVRFLPGEACGVSGFARVNLGARDCFFDAAIERLRAFGA